MTATAD